MKDFDDKIKGKIRKLLALATSDNEHEAATALRQAMKLMAKHGVEEGDLVQSEIVTVEVEHDWIKIPLFARILINKIGQAFGVCATYRHGAGIYKARSTLAGRSGDVRRAEYTYFAVMIILEKEMARKRKEVGKGFSVADYRYGLAIGLGAQLIEANKQAEDEIASEGTELMVIDVRLVEADAHMQSTVGFTTLTTDISHMDPYEVTAGRIKGKSLQINDGIEAK